MSKAAAATVSGLSSTSGSQSTRRAVSRSLTGKPSARVSTDGAGEADMQHSVPALALTLQPQPPPQGFPSYQGLRAHNAPAVEPAHVPARAASTGAAAGPAVAELQQVGVQLGLMGMGSALQIAGGAQGRWAARPAEPTSALPSGASGARVRPAGRNRHAHNMAAERRPAQPAAATTVASGGERPPPAAQTGRAASVALCQQVSSSAALHPTVAHAGPVPPAARLATS